MKNVILSIAAIVTVGTAQQLVIKHDAETSTIATSSAAAASIADKKTLRMQSGDEMVGLIVEFNAPSRVEQRLLGRTFSKTSATSIKQRVLSSVKGLSVTKEFETVFNGFTTTTRRENVQVIASIPGVKNVFYDVEVNSLPTQLSSSSAIVPVQTTTAASGKGVRIGIIDTGIDYKHEAFGGGYGDGFSVAGGYDFVNNDADPMDDNGHGTHVAGIIGGHSATINGTAYNAKLFAYKALNQSGSGNESTVIAAIERAIADSMDVLNISLGTASGGSNDPMAAAVNRAVEAGIVVVVAAGNTGAYESINSPGIAKLALTVGATDVNNIASFSAKGPVADQYQIKPDVVAPGVGILSAKNGGGYVQMSGTSMATPFVTAIVAAMKELHPEWNALQIKDAIIANTSSLGSGTSVFAEGHGKVDTKVLNATSIVSPAQISFGVNSTVEASWQSKRTITIYNGTTEKKHYRFTSSTTNPALQFTFTPSMADIEHSQTGDIGIELNTNNLFLSNNTDFANGYTGTIRAISETDTLFIPFAFFKGTVLHVTFNEVPWMVLIHNQKNFSKTLSPKTNQLSLVVKNDTYDIVASFYGSRYVIKENIATEGTSDVSITSTDAQFPVSVETIDELGKVLITDSTQGTYCFLEGLVHASTGFALISLGGGKTSPYINQPKYFSSMSNNYTFAYSFVIQPDNKTSYAYDAIIDSGIASAKTIVFQSTDLRRVDVKYDLDTTVRRIFPITWITYIGKTSTVGATFYDGKSEPLAYPFIQKAFHAQRSSSFPIFYQREAYTY